MKRTLNRRLLCILGGGMAVAAVLLLTRGFAADKEMPKEGVIDSPPKQFLAQSAPDQISPASEFINPKVEPGKVRWHKTFADARAAAKTSGKPVLLFQMMGKLDDRFC